MPVRVRGARRFRRLLKAVPDAVRGEIVVALNLAGRTLKAAMQARAPRRTGETAAAITFRVLPKTLRLRVGLIGRKGREDFPFYGRIQDLGRKAQVVTVHRRKVGVNSGLRRGRKVATDIAAVYKLRVKPMAGRHFVTGRFPEARAELRRDLNGIFGRALHGIAGTGDD